MFQPIFQIIRTTFQDLICLIEQVKPQEIRHIRSARDFSSKVGVNNNEPAQHSALKRNASKRCSVQTIKRTNVANSKNELRTKSNCTCASKCSRQLLAFCQPSVEDCSKCLDVMRVPVSDPGLCPIQNYDASKHKWKQFCPENICEKVDMKKYKEIPSTDCLAFKPIQASKLNRFGQNYTSLKKRKHPECESLCNNFCRLSSDKQARPTTNKPRRKLIDLCELDTPRMDDVQCWKQKRKIIPSKCCDTHCKHFTTLALSKITRPKHSYKYKIMQKKVRLYGKKSGKGKKNKSSNKKGCDSDKVTCNSCNRKGDGKCKNPECTCKKPKPICPPQCPKFRVKPCKKCRRHTCDEYVERPCKKIEAPYESYGDSANFYEDPVSECINYNEEMLQPQKLVTTNYFEIIVPAPPKFAHIDPEKERKCLAEKLPDPEPLPDDDSKWKNTCPQMTVCPCKPRSPMCCKEYRDKDCTKLHAPYKSFSDQCPQFPELEIDECSLVEKEKERYMVSFNKPKSKRERDCEKSKKRGTVDRSVRCGTKVKDINEDHTCEEIIIPTWASRKVRCNKPPRTIRRIPKSDKCKRPGKGPSGKCCSKKCVPKKIVSKCGKLASTLKPVGNETRKKPPSSPKQSCGKPKSKEGKCNKPKCPEPEKCKKDESGRYKKGSGPNPKCGGGGVKKNEKGCGNPKKNKFSGGHSEKKILIGQRQPRIQEPITHPSVLNFSTSKIIWEKVCECFHPRPDAPTVQECNQRLLEIKAREAAAAAGLQIYEPSCSYVTVDLKKSSDKCISSNETDCNLSPCQSSECEPKNLVSDELNNLEELKQENPESSHIPDDLKSHSDAIDRPILKTQNYSTLKQTVDLTPNKENFKSMKSEQKDLLKSVLNLIYSTNSRIDHEED